MVLNVALPSIVPFLKFVISGFPLKDGIEHYNLMCFLALDDYEGSKTVLSPFN
jgi:hypothetical protein